MRLAEPGTSSGPLLLVVPPGDSTQPPPPSQPLAGLPRLDRILLAAERAGLTTVLMTPLAPRERPLPGGNGSRARPVNSGGSPSRRGRVVLLADNVLPTVAWLRQLVEMPIEPGHLYADDHASAVLEGVDPEFVLGLVASHGTLEGTLPALHKSFRVAEGTADRGGRFVLGRPEDATAAEAWLLRGLIRSQEGFMSRHFERHVSLALTRRLAPHAITPNTMTVISLAIGFLSAPCFLSVSPAWQVAGALLLLTHSILDGCDGELARLKFLESKRGAILDFWGDNLVHVALFGSLALGWSAATGSSWPLVLGGVTVASTAGAAWALHGWATKPQARKTRRGRAERLVDALASRDFVYLILILAAGGRAGWFLVPAAVGTPIFAAVAIWSQGQKRT